MLNRCVLARVCPVLTPNMVPANDDDDGDDGRQMERAAAEAYAAVLSQVRTHESCVELLRQVEHSVRFRRHFGYLFRRCVPWYW